MPKLLFSANGHIRLDWYLNEHHVPKYIEIYC